ncbi:alpha-1,2-fucosyltransferase [Agreia bicolorata]|nr:alpha-1,2-fucosyltransferase [Agreia bicolorata]
MQEAVISWIQGGLGNQLFQINAGHHIASWENRPHLVSVSSYRRDALRNFTSAAIVDKETRTNALENALIGAPYSRAGSMKTRTTLSRLRIETTLEDASGKPAVLVGFFQEPDAVALSTHFVAASLDRFRERQSDHPLAKQIRGRVVVHVRRGDYASAPGAISAFGSIRPDFYLEATERLGVSIRDTVMFTDDPDYVIQTFALPSSQIIGPSDAATDLETLVLMSMGNGMVLPNSTFSWWAAELMNRPERTIAPEFWFVDHRKGQTLARDTWGRVPN